MGCKSSKQVEYTYDDDLPPLSGPRSRSTHKPSVSLDHPLAGAPMCTFNGTPANGHARTSSGNNLRSVHQGKHAHSVDNVHNIEGTRGTVLPGTPRSPTIVIQPPSSCGGSALPSPRTSMPPPPRGAAPAFLSAPPASSRDPSVTINIASYPHIIDAILDCASPELLIAFRATSRQCLEAADSRLFTHIVFDDTDETRRQALAKGDNVKMDWPGPTPLERLLVRAPSHRLPCPPWGEATDTERRTLADRLRHAKVLDYYCDCDHRTDRLISTALEGLQVVRRIWPSPIIVPAPTVIDYVDLSYAGYWTAVLGPDTMPNPTVHSLPVGVKTSIINFIYPTRLGDFLPHMRIGDLRGADIVLKFFPRNTLGSTENPFSRSPEFDNMSLMPLTVMMNGPKPYGFLGPLLTHLAGHMQTSTVTWVGLDDVPPALLGFPPSLPPEQLGCMIAMGMTVCHAMQFEIGRGWVYADRETSMAAWRNLHRMRFLRTWQYAVEKEHTLGVSAADAALDLEDVPPEAGDVSRLWIPGAPCPPFLIPTDPGPMRERFEDETIRAVQHWRAGFDNGQFGNGCWGEPC